MRRWSAWLILIVAVALVAVAMRQTQRWRALLSPVSIRTDHLPLDGEASIWIFVRAGCRHCEGHLAALQHALDLLPRMQRDRVRARLRVVGRVALPIADVRVFPDSLRRSVGVRTVPSTWWLDAEGHVHESWQGARNEVAWRRMLLAVSDVEVAP
jgi:hypothetical protein